MYFMTQRLDNLLIKQQIAVTEGFINCVIVYNLSAYDMYKKAL